MRWDEDDSVKCPHCGAPDYEPIPLYRSRAAEELRIERQVRRRFWIPYCGACGYEPEDLGEDEEDELRFAQRRVSRFTEEIAEATQSPIEQELAVALGEALHFVRCWSEGGLLAVELEVPRDVFPGARPEAPGPTVVLRPQERVGRYRLDFGLTVHIPDLHPGESDPLIALECDGHDFHERTAQQATRDKRRDRELQAAGWRVLRFTGAEIRADPRKAAEGVVTFAVEEFDKLHEARARWKAWTP